MMRPNSHRLASKPYMDIFMHYIRSKSFVTSLVVGAILSLCLLLMASPNPLSSNIGNSQKRILEHAENEFDPAHFKQINASVSASLEDFDPAMCPEGTTTTLTSITQCKKLTAFAFAMAAATCHARASVSCPDGRVFWGEGYGYAFRTQTAWNEMCLCLSQERQDPNQILCRGDCRDKNGEARALKSGRFLQEDRICLDANSEARSTKRRRLSSSLYETFTTVFWNTFYPVDVLNVFNPFSYSVEIDLKFFDKDGSRLDTEGLTLQIAANTKQDFLLHDLSRLSGITLAPSSYGSIRIESDNMLTYNMSMYEVKGDSFLPESVITSFQVPSSFPILGNSYVSDNTFVPGSVNGRNARSGDLDEAKVLPWLTLFNASDNLCNFNVTTYDQSGEERIQRSFGIGPIQRIDVNGLYQQDRIGLHKISAKNEAGADCPYQAYINRLGVEPDGKFRFSIFAPARVGDHVSTLSFRMPKGDSAAWVELSNLSTRAEPTDIKLSMYDYFGSLVKLIVVKLNSNEQIHFPLHELFKEGDIGQVKAEGINDENSRISLSVMYYENRSRGAITAYASHSTSLPSKEANGFANTYIGQRNLILLTNVSEKRNEASINLQDSTGEVKVNLASYATESIDLNSYMSPDAYSAYKVRGIEPLIVQSFTDSGADTYTLPNQGLPLAAQAGDNAFDPVDIDIDNPNPPPFNGIFDQCVDEIEMRINEELANLQNDPAVGECISGCTYAVAYAWAKCKASAFAFCPMGPWASSWVWRNQDACGYGYECAKLCVQKEFEPPPLCNFDPEHPVV